MWYIIALLVVFVTTSASFIMLFVLDRIHLGSVRIKTKIGEILDFWIGDVELDPAPEYKADSIARFLLGTYSVVRLPLIIPRLIKFRYFDKQSGFLSGSSNSSMYGREMYLRVGIIKIHYRIITKNNGPAITINDECFYVLNNKHMPFDDFCSILKISDEEAVMMALKYHN